MIKKGQVFCIIGAGGSGIVSAKYCLEQGYRVIVLEKESSIGGAWFSKSYEGVTLQTTKKSYAFSDFPHFPETGFYPNREEIMHYFQEYCRKYNIIKYCTFNTQVMETKFQTDIRKWEITYQNEEGISTIHTDFLIIASGFYTRPKIPNIVRTKHSNKVIHSSEFSFTGNYDSTIFKGKNIVIIGNGPTGLDLACIAHEKGANNVTILYKTNRWLFRRFWAFGGSTDFIVSRFIMKLAHILNKNITIIILIIIGLLLELPRGNFSMKVNTPDSAPRRGNLALNDKIMNYINWDCVDYIKTTDISINDNEIVYNKKKTLKYDLCIMATGFESNIPFLRFKEIPCLYKRIVHPDLPNCGFIGFAAAFNWIQVSELQIQWYLHFIQEKHDISQETMNKQIEQECNNISNKAYDYHDLSTTTHHYCDSLFKDIVGTNHQCKKNGWLGGLRYWFESSDYDDWYIKKFHENDGIAQ